MAKKFFYVCAGILMLAGAYAVGAGSVEAQVGAENYVVSVTAISIDGVPHMIAVTNNGNTYYRNNATGDNPWREIDNVFGFAPVAAEGSNLGDVKSMFR